MSSDENRKQCIWKSACTPHYFRCISVNVAGSTSEDQQLLVTELRVTSHLPTVRVLLVCILVIIILGGAGVGIWLLVGKCIS
jgi:hypothetical protein